MKSYWRALFGLGPGRIAASVLLALAVAGFEGAGLLMLAPLLSASGTGDMPRWIPVRVNLIELLLFWVIVVGLHAGGAALRDSLIFRLQRDLADRRRAALISAAMAMEWRAIVHERGSDLTTQLTTSTVRLQAGTGALLQAMARVLLLAAHAAVAMTIQPAAGALALLAGLGLAAARGRSLQRSIGRGRGVEAGARLLQSLADEQIASMKLIKAWGMGAQAAGRFRAELGRQAAEQSRRYGAHLAEAVLSRVLSALCAAFGVWGAVVWLGLSGSSLLVLAAVFLRLLPAAGDIVRMAGQAAESLPAWTEGEALLTRFRVAAEPEEQAGIVAPAGDIVFAGVSYAWSGRVEKALDEVAVTIAEGSFTALIGPSGAGKSTLADLAIGLLPPDCGTVSIGGVPLRGPLRAVWRRQCAYVPQESFLFNSSVGDNLRWGRPDASDAQLWSALAAAQADELVRRLPEGLNTLVGDRGMRLSGGERQRLALARALLREPAFLVLDEATSALDGESEEKILAALDGLRGKLTILVIAHRLSTVRDADRVLRLQDGRVVISQ